MYIFKTHKYLYYASNGLFELTCIKCDISAYGFICICDCVCLKLNLEGSVMWTCETENLEITCLQCSMCINVHKMSLQYVLTCIKCDMSACGFVCICVCLKLYLEGSVMWTWEIVQSHASFAECALTCIKCITSMFNFMSLWLPHIYSSVQVFVK